MSGKGMPERVAARALVDPGIAHCNLNRPLQKRLSDMMTAFLR